MKCKKVLIIAASLDIGGAEKVARDIALYSPNGYEFHYLVFGDKIGAYEDMLQKKGHLVLHFREPSENYFYYFRALLQLMKEEHYDIVHAHNMFNCGMTMLAAKMAGIPVRISHAHSSLKKSSGLFRHWYECMMRILILRCGTDYVACGVEAGYRLFGKEMFEKHGKLILNGIDVQTFAFSEEKRIEIRNQLNMAERLILGHAGHLSAVKNQSFLLDLMPEILEEHPGAVLLLLGEGQDRTMLEQKVEKMGLKGQVVLTGNVPNVSDYLCAMDVFVFPSLYEGLPLSLLEAQRNGLPCVISDCIPRDVFLTNLIHPISLDAPKEEWVQKIINVQRKRLNTDFELLLGSEYTTERAMQKIYSLYETGGVHG